MTYTRCSQKRQGVARGEEGGTRAPGPVREGTERSGPRSPAPRLLPGRGAGTGAAPPGLVAGLWRHRGAAAAGTRPCGARGAAAAAMPGQKSFRRRREDEDEEEEDEQLAEEVRWVGRRRGTGPGSAGTPMAPGPAAVEGLDGTRACCGPAARCPGVTTSCRDISSPTAGLWAVTSRHSAMLNRRVVV